MSAKLPPKIPASLISIRGSRAVKLAVLSQLDEMASWLCDQATTAALDKASARRRWAARAEANGRLRANLDALDKLRSIFSSRPNQSTNQPVAP